VCNCCACKKSDSKCCLFDAFFKQDSQFLRANSRHSDETLNHNDEPPSGVGGDHEDAEIHFGSTQCKDDSAHSLPSTTSCEDESENCEDDQSQIHTLNHETEEQVLVEQRSFPPNSCHSDKNLSQNDDPPPGVGGDNQDPDMHVSSEQRKGHSTQPQPSTTSCMDVSEDREISQSQIHILDHEAEEWVWVEQRSLHPTSCHTDENLNHNDEPPPVVGGDNEDLEIHVSSEHSKAASAQQLPSATSRMDASESSEDGQSQNHMLDHGAEAWLLVEHRSSESSD